MNSTIRLIFIVLGVVNCSDEFHCKPRLGCHIVKCDPSPPDYLKDVKRNEFPITCMKSPDDEEPQTISQETVISLLKDISVLKTEIAALDRRNDELENNYRTLSERTAKLESENKEFESTYKKQLRKVESRHEEKLKKLESDHRKQMKDIEERLVTENVALSANITILTKKSGELESNYKILYDRSQKIEAKCKSSELKYQQQMKEMEARQEAKLDELKSNYQEKLSETEERLQNKDIEILSRVYKLQKEIEAMESDNKPSLESNSAVVTTTKSPLPTSTATSIATALSTTKKELTDLCHVRYSGKCFKVVLHDSWDVSYSVAEKICNEYGGKKANIYSEQHYNELTSYIRTILPNGRQARNFWLGMRHENGRVLLSDGTIAPFTKWVPGEPHGGVNRYMGMDVKRSITDVYQHMWDGVDGLASGVICEI